MSVEGMPEFLYRVSETLRDPQERLSARSGDGAIRLLDRPTYLDEAARNLETSRTFYGAYAGPSCFHPQWFYALQHDAEMRRVSPSPGSARMDSALGRLLERRGGDERWVIFRNSPTYVIKVRAVTSDSRLLATLRDETLERIDKFCDNVPESARFTSFDTGHLRIPYIFDDCIVTARRQTSVELVQEAMMTSDAIAVQFERSSFRQVFVSACQSVEEERAALKAFVAGNLP